MTDKMTRLLAIAGIAPFAACAAMLLAGVREAPHLGDVQRLVASYSLLILAFMAGVHWGQRLSGIAAGLNLFILSNVVALAGWFAYLFFPARLYFGALIALFVLLFAIDRMIAARGGLSPHYLQTRTGVTAAVVACLCAIAFKA